jgi:Putative inner membrane protein (DUF1819).
MPSHTVKKSPYSASFTAAALMHGEMNALLPYLLKDGLSETIKIIENSVEILPIKSAAARYRIANEMVKRFKAVPQSFWVDYQMLPEHQQKLALFYVILKTYRLLYEFQLNVAVKRFNSANNSLQIDDLWMEFYNIAARDPFVESWTERTKKTCIQSYLTMLRQVGLLDPETSKLQRIDIAQEAYIPFAQLGELWFLQACFIPAYEIETIKSLAL